MKGDVSDNLQKLFTQHYGHPAEAVQFLTKAGSDRQYYRLFDKGNNIVGTYNPHADENKAFILFTRHFEQKGLNVPGIIASDEDHHIYLQEDLGDTSLFSLINSPEGAEKNISFIRKALFGLASFQLKGDEGFNYDWTFSGHLFDHHDIVSDLNYWKYYFLRPLHISCDGQALDNDFNALADWLITSPLQYFMYRDFQSRNIMVKKGQLYFIDYQGGRKGPALYDCASFLWQAKSGIGYELKEQLAGEYMEELLQVSGVAISREKLQAYYRGFVLLRLLQVLGAYGYRGLFERKSHFLASISPALDNLSWWLDHYNDLPLPLTELRRVLKTQVGEDIRKRFVMTKPEKIAALTIHINSFSYKHGLPVDRSGNGGGFVFDCRFIDNPGRKEEYKLLTGKDEPVISYLSTTAMPQFLEHVFSIVDKAVENYVEREFANLMISFGCTGGQHRSVYAAEELSRHIQERFAVKVILLHIEQEKKKQQL